MESAKTTGKISTLMHLARLKMLTGSWVAAHDLVEETMPCHQNLRGILKAAVGASSLSDMGGDYFDTVETYFQSIQSRSAFLSIAQEGQAVPLNSSIFVGQAVAGSTGDNGTVRPISKIALDAQGIKPVSASCILVATRESLTSDAARDLLRRELDAGVIAAVDKYFLGECFEAIGSDLAPGVGYVASDIKTMLTSIVNTGAERPVLVVDPITAISLATASDGTMGIPLYPDFSINGGVVHGVRTLVSGNLPEATSEGSYALMVDGAALVHGIEALEFSKPTDAGLVDLSDDPEGSSLVSLFQMDAVGMKVTTRFGYVFARNNAFAGMLVNW